jgi:predicted nucleic acid-binding protein
MPNSVYIDASAYIALLNPQDAHHNRAIKIIPSLEKLQPITSQAVLGEVLTVGSMRFDKEATIRFVQVILKSNTQVVLEKNIVVEEAFRLFQKTTSKNISWVDCYSQAIINYYQISKIFSFDNDFKQLNQL